MTKAWRASRRAWLLATLAGLSIPCAQAAAPDAILGTWLTDDGASKVEVTAVKAPDGSSVYGGKISWLKEPTRDGKPLRDANNADSGAARAADPGHCRSSPGFKAGRRLERRHGVFAAQRQELPGRVVDRCRRTIAAEDQRRSADQDRLLDALKPAFTASSTTEEVIG